jgi:high-affinity Fe2+/Pb2+ permease
MKRIYFDNLSNQKIWILLMIISLILVLNGVFKFIIFENPTTHKYISSIGFLIIVIFMSKLFWFKNTVQWNKKGIVIRIKTFLGKSIKFEEIKETNLNENVMEITKKNGHLIQIDVSEIAKSDSRKLKDIILKNTIPNIRKM